MPGSVAIIGAGQIGYVAAEAFLAAGWEVRVMARSLPPWPLLEAEFVAYEKGAGRTPAADVVIDTIAFGPEEIEVYRADHVGRLIVVSSASVYCDDNGRTLDEAAQTGFPDFPDPIGEDCATVAPGPQSYSTRKIAMEVAAREHFGERATILRPCAIHGAWSRHPREWWFVKRLLDGRRVIPLACRGESRFQTTAARIIGAFAVHAVTADLGGTFNLADSDSPATFEIGRSIALHLGLEADLVPFADYPPGGVGRTPWSVPAPFMVSGAKASRTGFKAGDRYGDGGAAIDWLTAISPDDWRAAFPQLAAYPWNLFDYPAEDRFLARA